MMGRFGFCLKWRKWIRECIFSGKCSVLVNGSPTQEIEIEKGLKQGDPLAPFLFLLVAEGLSGLMNKTISLRKFSGCKIGTVGPQISILQYADDTLVGGEATWDNLWVIKSVFRCFELVSGLKVNFNKTRLFGINVDQSILSSGAQFLNCKIGVLPFKYLGLPIGANTRSLVTWQPIIDSLARRLASWKGRHLSLGGRITLINLVLNNLPIYFFVFPQNP